jgi:molybdopterin converting factor small subunit
VTGPLDEDWDELTPEQQAEQDEQLIRDVERRYPELAETIRNDLALRRRINAVGDEFPDDLKAELAELDYERRLTAPELLALASDIHRQADRRIKRLMRLFDELTGFEE